VAGGSGRRFESTELVSSASSSTRWRSVHEFRWTIALALAPESLHGPAGLVPNLESIVSKRGNPSALGIADDADVGSRERDVTGLQ